ncbi:hypothetical protein E2C01_003346 [Portunus trituberculatus]|uniref:Uncharacterized protein n=1 Tax=Portunus trituberculatus TaxID=210409 RepID=A0A5B7CM55_PORTR|nr:hypothetical protein [Portunus trituberculatus]
MKVVDVRVRERRERLGDSERSKRREGGVCIGGREEVWHQISLITGTCLSLTSSQLAVLATTLPPSASRIVHHLQLTIYRSSFTPRSFLDSQISAIT